MSGIRSKSTKTKTTIVVGGGGLVDPTVEITQPGGPYNYGEAILTDGAGGYTIAPTLRPYFVSFRIPSCVKTGGYVDCEHQGVITSTAGFVLTLPTNLIAISVSVDLVAETDHAYIIEIVKDPTGDSVVVGSLVLEPKERYAFRRDLSVELDAGDEIGARVVHGLGARDSTFSTGIIVAEFEA